MSGELRHARPHLVVVEVMYGGISAIDVGPSQWRKRTLVTVSLVKTVKAHCTAEVQLGRNAFQFRSERDCEWGC